MARGTGSTVMFNKCHNNALPIAWTAFFFAKTNFITAGAGALTAILKNNIDMTVSYLPGDADYDCKLTSTSLKATTYHELGHAQHYNQVGCGFWIAYRSAIINELTKLNQDEYAPYGTGQDENNAPIIATGEMWGNHCEYIYTNRHYGNGGSASGSFVAAIQGAPYNNIPGGLNCYLNAIENFNPNKTSDIWRWIPQGLCNDLTDPVGETVPVIDNVNGYTNQQCFTALQSDVQSIPGFMNKLLLQNNNYQQTLRK